MFPRYRENILVFTDNVAQCMNRWYNKGVPSCPIWGRRFFTLFLRGYLLPQVMPPCQMKGKGENNYVRKGFNQSQFCGERKED